MTDFFNSLTVIEKVFLTSAVIGGALFLIRTILMFVVGQDDVDVHGDADIDLDHVDADVSFKLLSLQGLTAFFMMFGLTGLALSKQSGAPEVIAVLGGVVAGCFTVWVIGKIFVGMKKLQSDGTMHISRAIGEQGTVYLTIPANGTGKVRISVQDHLKVFDAVSANKEEIKTDERILVIDVISQNVMVVEKV